MLCDTYSIWQEQSKDLLQFKTGGNLGSKHLFSTLMVSQCNVAFVTLIWCSRMLHCSFDGVVVCCIVASTSTLPQIPHQLKGHDDKITESNSDVNISSTWCTFRRCLLKTTSKRAKTHLLWPARNPCWECGRFNVQDASDDGGGLVEGRITGEDSARCIPPPPRLLRPRISPQSGERPGGATTRASSGGMTSPDHT